MAKNYETPPTTGSFNYSVVKCNAKLYNRVVSQNICVILLTEKQIYSWGLIS